MPQKCIYNRSVNLPSTDDVMTAHISNRPKCDDAPRLEIEGTMAHSIRG